MTDHNIEALLDSAAELAYDPNYCDRVRMRDISKNCAFDIKIDDDEWDFVQDGISPKTAELVDNLFKDLTETFNAETASKYTVNNFKEEYRRRIIFSYTKGCLLLSLDVPQFLDLAFHSYEECARSSSVPWNKVFSGSLFAFATMLQGSRSWYSLAPIFELQEKNKKLPPIKDSLNFAYKMLAYSRRTPDYLVKTLSSASVVRINKESYINAEGLSNLRYEPDHLDRYFVDDEFRIKSFAANSIRMQLGSSDKSVSIQDLKGKNREKMADLARKAVKEEMTTKSNLQVDVFFKGVKYDSAKVVAFGDKREKAIPAKELFANPIYSLAVDSVFTAPPKKSKSKSKKIVPGQAGLFDPDPSEQE